MSSELTNRYILVKETYELYKNLFIWTHWYNLKYVTTGTIAVSCDTFATEYNADCLSADYLMVSDGNSELGTFCGKYYTSYNL